MSQEFESDFETEAAPGAIPTSFGTVTDRLSEIADIMEDETMPLDDALDLLEEAVALGMQASSLLESDMNERDAEEDEETNEGVEEAAEASEEAAEDVRDESAEEAAGESAEEASREAEVL